MFTELKRYIEDIINTSESISVRSGGHIKEAYISAVKNHFCIREEIDIMDGISMELRWAIHQNLIHPCKALVKVDTSYYIIHNIKDNSSVDPISVLYKKDSDVDMVWVFGLPDNVVIALEWNVHTSSGKRYFESSSVIFDNNNNNNFISSMSMFFTGTFPENI